MGENILLVLEFIILEYIGHIEIWLMGRLHEIVNEISVNQIGACSLLTTNLHILKITSTFPIIPLYFAGRIFLS